MKEIGDLVVTCADYGTFLCLAERISKDVAKVNYHSPVESEYRNVKQKCIGYGVPGIHKIESFMHPDVVAETDLWIFPDIGYGGEQAYLRSIGKPVWGSNDGDELERLRTRFIDTVEALGLPMVESHKIRGLSNLVMFLKDKTDWWVKINEFRDNMETWKHQDDAHSQPMFAYLADEFGGAKELVWFVVQKDLPDAQEIGYDGWSVDGWFPDSSYQGYEGKNELYLGARTEYDKLPEQVRYVNEKWSEVLKQYSFRNFFATEIRLVDGEPHFIDPTQRMPGQTGEQLLKTLDNITEVIWKGAQGELVQPVWNYDFATSATIHHRDDLKGWRVADIPEEARDWVMPYRYMMADGLYHFPPNKVDEIGVVIGAGDTAMEAIDALKENFDKIGDYSLSIHPEGFKELIEQIEEAAKEGVDFGTKPIPSPVEVIS